MAKILIIEDDKNMLELLTIAVEDAGHTVCGKTSATAAIHVCCYTKFDLIITDIRLGEVDGISCLRAIKEVLPKVKTIVITGFASQDCPSEAMELQVNGFLYKPFELRELARTVKSCLGAQEDRKKYNGIIERLMSCCRTVIRSVNTVWLSRQLSYLERDRDSVFNAFFIGIRSRALGQISALKYYDALEELEEGRETFRRLGQERKVGGFAKLLEAYRLVRNSVIATCRSPHLGTLGKRSRGVVAREHFSRFYNRIMAGDIPLEMLRVAPILRLAIKNGQKLEPEARELAKLIWGDLPEETPLVDEILVKAAPEAVPAPKCLSSSSLAYVAELTSSQSADAIPPPKPWNPRGGACCSVTTGTYASPEESKQESSRLEAAANPGSSASEVELFAATRDYFVTAAEQARQELQTRGLDPDSPAAQWLHNPGDSITLLRSKYVQLPSSVRRRFDRKSELKRFKARQARSVSL